MNTTCLHHSGLETQIKGLCTKMELHMDKMQIQMEMIDKSIGIAKSEMDRRLEGMNEFRNQLSAQAQTFISKREVELMIEKIDGRIGYLERRGNVTEGSKVWSNHIITVLISVFVTSVVMLIGPIMVKVITR